MLMHQVLLKKNYEYRDSFKKHIEGLPIKDKFYNTLTNRAISDKNEKYLKKF